MKLEGLTVNFLGDSITQGCGTSCPEAMYHAVLKRNTGLKEVRNYGIGGTRFALQSGTTQRPKDDYVDLNSYCERFDKMEDADLVVVFGGTNDFGHGDAPIGTPSDRTPETFYGACHYLFTGLIKKYIGKPIVIITPTPREWDVMDYPINDTVVHRTLKEYVEIIREVAEYYSLPVLDLYATSGLQPALPIIEKEYMPDKLHPNDKGHEILYRKIVAFLRSI
jgi:lysophospholipase L1-like esterase